MSEFNEKAYVDGCVDAYRVKVQMEMKNGMSPSEAQRSGARAFRAMLPLCDSMRGIQLYIACVTAGIAYGVIGGRDASAMLYAAQVAIAARKPLKQRRRKVVSNG